jgi:hypothetical protein
LFFSDKHGIQRIEEQIMTEKASGNGNGNGNGNGSLG